MKIEKIEVEAKSRTLKATYTMVSTLDIYLPNILPDWKKISIDMPSNESVYHIRSREAQEWVESHPFHMWKYSYASLGMYVFTEEMEMLFLLRWS